jgi:hypothetical protein
VSELECLHEKAWKLRLGRRGIRVEDPVPRIRTVVQRGGFSGVARLRSAVVPVRIVSVLLALVLGVAVGGCGDAAHGQASRDSATEQPAGAGDDRTANDGYEDDGYENDAIDVPDVSGQDGSAAQSDVGAAGLTATFADANHDPGFDSGRDGSGCEVTDQDPPAGETAADGDEVQITIDCAQVDWDNHEGSGWEAFSDAYSSSFDDGCQALFGESPDGALYEDDVQYMVGDCHNLNPGDGSEASDIPADVPDDPEAAGAELGELDGCRALFDEQGVYSLNWGEDSITSDDCPITAGVSAPVPHKKKAGRSHTKRPGQGCSGTQADGMPLALKIDKGTINCSGAQALWREFIGRAPTEGAGSSGAMTLDDWECAAATAAEAPRLGGCNRVDDSAAFTVYSGE